MPDLMKNEPMKYSELLEMRADPTGLPMMPTEEGRARDGEYFELVRFLIWILDHDSGAAADQSRDDSDTVIVTVPSWDLIAEIGATTGELHSIEWSGIHPAHYFRARFEGRHDSPRFPARYPRKMYVDFSDPSGTNQHDSNVFEFRSVTDRPDLGDEIFDWRTTHKKARIMATGQTELASGELIEPEPGFRPSLADSKRGPIGRSLPTDPLAKLKPKQGASAMMKTVLAGSITLLVAGVALAIRSRVAR